MHPPRYLFLHADTNDIFTTDEAPTPQDLEGAKVGTQVIMRLADLHFYGYAGEWLPIPRGELAFTDTDDNHGTPFHAPPLNNPVLILARAAGESPPIFPEPLAHRRSPQR